MPSNTAYLLALLTLLCGLTGCGGGDGGTPAPPVQPVPPGQTPPPGAPNPPGTPSPPSATSDALDRTTSLSGVDADKDGVRDDVKSYIVGGTWDANSKTAAVQLAAGVQAAILSTNLAEANVAASKMDAAIVCMSTHHEKFGQYVQSVMAVTANTPERFAAYLRFERLIGPTVIELPSEQTACK